MDRDTWLIDCIHCISLIVYFIAAISGNVDADPWEVLSAMLKIIGYLSLATKALHSHRELER